jgi:hypothetical protein
MGATIEPNSQNTSVQSNMLASGTDSSAQTMSPESIIAYVENTLGNVDGQLLDFQNQAEAKNKLANDWRAYKQLVREYSGSDANNPPFPTTSPERENEIARREAELKQFDNCTDPELKQAVEDLRGKLLLSGPIPPPPSSDENDYIAFTEADRMRLRDTAVEGYQMDLNSYHPTGVNKDQAGDMLKSADDALQTLNQDNELTMMRLSALVQQRLHVTTFATNQLEAINQCVNGVLQNMR